MAGEIPPQYHNVRIEVVRLDYGIWKDSIDFSGVRPPPNYVYPPGTPPLVAAAGIALGYGLAYAVRSAGVREAAVANFELNVGGYSINSIDVIPLKGKLSPEQALERAITSGVRTLAEKLSAMQYWKSPYQKDSTLPKPSLNADVPHAALRPRNGSRSA